ncbi:4022_t:CDS:2 [Funneliformis caledonium]|uniref:4022_t:CDS:1 n=1 Tax=Funneliformis caledonium TaxID=1117310 RepID=A0A9N9IC36_9GLOM|nr:4022_t:CDS:2 [Funneliformis caledonium]
MIKKRKASAPKAAKPFNSLEVKLTVLFNNVQDNQVSSKNVDIQQNVSQPFAKENYNPDDDLEHNSILSLITNKKIKNDNNDLEQILRSLLSKGRISDQIEDTIDQINQLLSNIQDEQ